MIGTHTWGGGREREICVYRDVLLQESIIQTQRNNTLGYKLKASNLFLKKNVFGNRQTR